MSFTTGFVVFPNLTQLDFTGPLQVLHRLPGATTHIVAKTRAPVPSDCPLAIPPTATFADCPPLDLLCVPGGFGVDQAMEDEETDRLRAPGGRPREVRDERLHRGLHSRGGRPPPGQARDDALGLSPFSAARRRDSGAGACRPRRQHVHRRRRHGRRRLRVRRAERDRRPTVAQTVQLGIEYDPQPPFVGGSPPAPRRRSRRPPTSATRPVCRSSRRSSTGWRRGSAPRADRRRRSAEAPGERRAASGRAGPTGRPGGARSGSGRRAPGSGGGR